VTFEHLIERKRDGFAHTVEEMDCIVLDYARGEVPDYQMSAWLMAAFLNGLNGAETVALTDAMVRSGRVVDLSSIPGRKVDKHSTGGVADTTTLVLAPLVAACGVPVAKMSGRGLGHTGGTLDKLESIPGFRVELTPEEFTRQVRDIGVAVIAQTPDVDPADKRMYALRDVTATVPSIPLIVGSIISKKIAGGADAIVLDVKVGSGAFMKTVEEARRLSAELVRVGEALGRHVECVLTDMDQPLGMAVGNALEVEEAIQVLRGAGPEALTELCLIFAAKMLIAGGVTRDTDEARALASEAIASGAALRKFKEWVAAQGGDPAIADDTSLLPQATLIHEVRAVTGGYVASIDAEEVGRAAAGTGAGRLTLEDAIDPAAGLVLAVRVGDAVSPGSIIATIHGSRESAVVEAAAKVASAIRLTDVPVAARALLIAE